MSVTANPKLLLSKTEEWASWFSTFKRNAETTDVWKFVNPGPFAEDQMVPTLEKPSEVTYDGEVARLAARGDGQETIKDLNEAQLKVFVIRQGEYKTKMTQYLSDRKSYSDLMTWVHQTVDLALIKFLPETANLRDIIIKLKELVGVTEAYKIELARLAYRKALHTNRRTSPVDWYNQWELAYREGEKLEIFEVEGDIAIGDFLEAVKTFDLEWAKRYKDDLRKDQRATGKSSMTLLEVGKQFLDAARDNVRDKPSSGAFSTTNPSSSSEKGHDCPCGLAKNRHFWAPTDCTALHVAVNGIANSTRPVREDRMKKAKAAMTASKWKTLIEAVKAAKPASGGADSSWPPPMAQMVIDQSTPEGRQLLAFSTMPQAHPLRDSTLLDNCASTHVVNNRDLLVDVHPASASDVVLVGDTALQVVCRGKRIMRNAFNGPGGRNTRDLVLNNVAFVPGFHTNLISGNELRALGYWSCTLDDTLRFGTMASNKIMMNMSSKSNNGSVHWRNDVLMDDGVKNRDG
ncbi:uncharacterized protein HRG_07407 [Hirsutella rhossiliensis]|uniref:Retrovirus-related Pol polyprotein from transposon TNT 1-94-like beta-barrel domain-containing protein n=1 Tax=Hirsutella rhossiliensis TaxID=111463 RepID=A0A9P8MUD4_9HYPO|nr:uncharacterized protein HRG_07407 [Hirsutella rhossiliensis]KAH0961329.1 hypothetical protein HRG_07407 [Hirsutella rhossiliensis]